MRYILLPAVLLSSCAVMPGHSAYEACNRLDVHSSYGEYISSNDNHGYKRGSTKDDVLCSMRREPDRKSESSAYIYWHYYDPHDYTGTTIVFRDGRVEDWYASSR